MAIYKVDISKRVAWSMSTTGYYNWTNVYYFNAPTPGDYVDALDIIIPADRDLHLNVVDQGVYRVTRLSDNVVVEEDLIYSAHNTHLPGDFLTLTNTLRATGRCADGSLYYKRYRVPLRAVDMASPSELTPSAMTLFGILVKRARIGGYLCSRSGSPVERIDLLPGIFQWQWRDGTKRRSRPVLR